MTVPVVQCKGATKCFDDNLAVNGVSLELSSGEIISILGPSGCGKTTLLRLLAGFEMLDDGQIAVQSRVVSSKTVHVPPERRNIGMVFQEYALFPHMTVAQNISFGLQNVSGEEKKERTAEVLELVQLTGLENRYPHELSGGQQQRVALARTLAPRPVTVLLDEPFSNLDAGMRWEVRQEVETILRANEIATIFVTHDREEAFAVADRVGVMTEGRLEQIDTPNALYLRPANPLVARLVSTCDFLRGKSMNGVADTEIGRLPYVCTSGHIPNGADVSVLVRPDDLHVVSDPQGRSVISSREFRGGETILVVKTPSGVSIRCRQIFFSDLTTGTKVTLSSANSEPFLAYVGSDASVRLDESS